MAEDLKVLAVIHEGVTWNVSSLSLFYNKSDTAEQLNIFYNLKEL